MIDEIVVDGNCLFRAVAKQMWGNSREYQKVRIETVDFIIKHKKRFSAFEPDIDSRLAKQLLDRTCG